MICTFTAQLKIFEKCIISEKSLAQTFFNMFDLLLLIHHPFSVQLSMKEVNQTFNWVSLGVTYRTSHGNPLKTISWDVMMTEIISSLMNDNNSFFHRRNDIEENGLTVHSVEVIYYYLGQ